MLQIENLHAWYGKSQVLHGVAFEVQPGEIVALLGRNGSGRSTTAKAIMGLVRWEGGMVWKGQSLQGRTTCEIARAGIGYVPESREVFPGLTVHQNLLLGQKGTEVAKAAAGRLATCTACFRASKSASMLPLACCRVASSRC